MEDDGEPLCNPSTSRSWSLADLAEYDGEPLCNPLGVKLEPIEREEDDAEFAYEPHTEFFSRGPQTVKKEPGEEPATEEPASSVSVEATYDELLEAAYEAATDPAVDPATEAELWAAYDAALRLRLALAFGSL